MKRFLYLFSVLLMFAIGVSVGAQTQGGTRDGVYNEGDMPPEFRRRTFVMDIESRILGADKKVLWSVTNNEVTTLGTPVGVQLVGSNIVVSVKFTPYIRRDGNVLVAQGQVWIAESNGKVSSYSSIQTIPMEFGEEIYYFPLGASENINPSIEMVIKVTPNETGRGLRRPANNSVDGR